MSRVLVTEKIADTGLDRLRNAGHEVDVRLGLTPDELNAAIVGAAAIVVRSATQVNAEAVAAGSDLVAIGRAGVGLDNVDVEAATSNGVLVANAPQSNIVSAAEQTMALLLAVARNLPQAHGALKEGRWERSKWNGVELDAKTLGIIGVGNIGALVAQRAAAFGMKLIGFDPYIEQSAVDQYGVELVSLEELTAQSDFVTLHLAKTPETMGLVGADFFAKAKSSLRIVNVSRGGIIDEAALFDALSSGEIAGAGLDVWETEPTTESPLFDLPNIVVAPHLGASTVEAQSKAGDQVAEQIVLALAGETAPFAVNADAIS